MRPPMNQRVIYSEPVVGPDGKPVYDKYQRPQITRHESVARVQRKSQIVRDAQGTERRVSLEIDLPPEVDPKAGTEISFELADGREDTGTIITKDEAVNLAGNRVYYRTVYVDG